jgi:hypothetical protein
MRCARFCLLVIAAIGLVSCHRRSDRVAVDSDDQLTLRLPDGRNFQVDIIGEPFSGQNAPFQMALQTESPSPIRISIEDVLCIDKDHQTYELLKFADPAVFKERGVPLIYEDLSGHAKWSLGAEPSTLTGEGQPGPEAQRLNAGGCIPYDDRKAVSEINSNGSVVLTLATAGKRKFEITSPYPIVGIKRGSEGKGPTQQ